MRKIPVLFCLALLGLLRMNAQTINVYPGDANANGICNHVDILQLGQAFSFTGPPRNAQDIIWSPHPALPWVGSPAAINAAHSDCNGDGLVDRFDALAIDNNFGSGAGFFTADDTTFGTPLDPIIGINLVQDSIFVQGSTLLTLSLELGTVSNPIDSIYGLAVTIAYDPMIVDSVTLNFTGGFLSDSLNPAIIFSRADILNGKIYLSITNIDHSNRMGFGTIGSIGIVMDDNIRINGRWDLLMQPIFAQGVTANAASVNFFPLGDTLTVITGRMEPELSGISIFPNPATNQIVVSSAYSQIVGMKIIDVQGRIISEKRHLKTDTEILEIDHLSPGYYFLEVETESGILRKKLIIKSY